MINTIIIKFQNQKKLDIYKISKNKLYIVFLHGFMSDLEGKNLRLFKICKKNKLGFLALRILWSWKIFWKIY